MLKIIPIFILLISCGVGYVEHWPQRAPASHDLNTVSPIGSNPSDNIIRSWSFPEAPWFSPNDIPSSIYIMGQNWDAAMDDNGNTIIVWNQSDGSNWQVYKSEYRNGHWTHPTSVSDHISQGGTDVYYCPHVSIDNNGNAIIVWSQYIGLTTQIFKSEYRNGHWTHPSSISDYISLTGQNASDPQVAMNNSGNAIIVWNQFNLSNYQIFKSEYINGLWTHPTDFNDNISPDATDTSNPKVAMDDNGNIIIIWVQTDWANFQVFKSEFRSGLWTHPSALVFNISPDGQNTQHPQVAMDNNGNAIIVWDQLDGSFEQIFKSEYRNGHWTNPLSLSDNISPDGKHAFLPQVSMNDLGNAIIVWEQSDGSNYQIFKSEYRNGFWTNPSDLSDNISPDGQDTMDPSVAMDNSGNIIITWDQYDGTTNYQIYKSEYRNGGWTHPSNLNDNISPHMPNNQVYFPKVVMSTNNDAIIFWGQNNYMFKSEYRNGSWVHPSVGIAPQGSDVNSTSQQLAMDDNGNVIITWLQSDGSKVQTFKSEYRNGHWTNPSSLADNISPDGQHTYTPQVAMDNNGNAIITWYQGDGSNTQIFKSEYRNGNWTIPLNLTDNISPDGQDAIGPHVAMDDNGNAIITWYQGDGSNTQIFKSEYRNGNWTIPSNLTDNISPDGQDATEPYVAMDNNGNAIIVWDEYAGSSLQIFRSEYRNGQWNNPVTLNDHISIDGTNAYNPEVVMDNNGNAIITWFQTDGSKYQIFKSEYRNGHWTHPTSLSDNISPDGQDATGPHAAMDDNGNAIIVWQQKDGSKWQIFKSEYHSGHWTHPTSLSDNISPDGQDAQSQQVAMDNNGNAIITWMQTNGTNDKIFKSEYRNGGWTFPLGLSDNISFNGAEDLYPEVAMSNNGSAILIWNGTQLGYYRLMLAEYK